MDTGGKFAPHLDSSGAWGNPIHEKNLKQKISRHCPLKFYICSYYLYTNPAGDSDECGTHEVLVDVAVAAVVQQRQPGIDPMPDTTEE